MAHAKSVEAISDTEYVWIGEFQRVEGTVMIIAKDGNVFGHITVGDEAYEIHDFGDGVSLFVQIDGSKFTEEECASTDSGKPKETSHLNDGSNARNGSGGNFVIRILVLFTPNAEAVVININSTAALAVQQINTALVNSEVTNLDVNLVGVQELDFTETDDDIVGDIQNLTGNVAAQALRNDFEADVVVLLTNGNYGNIFGIVRDIGPINGRAYGIVEVDAAAGRYTFAHEVAHLVGARHDTDPNPTFGHGYSFSTGALWWRKTRRTILNSLPQSESRILNYSNPDVKFKRKDTGTDNADNARQLLEEGCTVAGFRNFTPPMAVNIYGPVYGNNAGTYTWSSNVSNGVAPFTYQWEYSTDGFNYSPFGTSPSITAQLPENNDLYLLLTATDSNGNQDVDFHFTSNDDSDGCIICKSDVVNESNGLREDTFVFYPNPTDSKINIDYKTQIPNTIVYITVHDLTGNVVLSKELVQLEEEMHTTGFDVSGLKLGQYILKVQSANTTEMKRLVISK